MTGAFDYVCRTCGEQVPADEWELSQHALTHRQILLTERTGLIEEEDG